MNLMLVHFYCEHKLYTLSVLKINKYHGILHACTMYAYINVDSLNDL